jgi:hypothetical protein
MSQPGLTTSQKAALYREAKSFAVRTMPGRGFRNRADELAGPILETFQYAVDNGISIKHPIGKLIFQAFRRLEAKGYYEHNPNCPSHLQGGPS